MTNALWNDLTPNDTRATASPFYDHFHQTRPFGRAEANIEIAGWIRIQMPIP
jgi:hypothetical protein